MQSLSASKRLTVKTKQAFLGIIHCKHIFHLAKLLLIFRNFCYKAAFQKYRTNFTFNKNISEIFSQAVWSNKINKSNSVIYLFHCLAKPDGSNILELQIILSTFPHLTWHSILTAVTGSVSTCLSCCTGSYHIYITESQECIMYAKLNASSFTGCSWHLPSSSAIPRWISSAWFNRGSFFGL